MITVLLVIYFVIMFFLASYGAFTLGCKCGERFAKNYKTKPKMTNWERRQMEGFDRKD